MIMSDVFPAALTRVSSPSSLKHILRAVRIHLGMEVGFISEFVKGRRVFRHVEMANGVRCIEVGGSDPLEESYCYWVVEGKLERLIRDPADHALTANLPATNALPVGAHLSVPIRLRDGTLYGTFCCFSFKPDLSLTQRDLATMEAFAEIAAEQIQESVDASRSREKKLRRIRCVLRTDGLQMVYQPAVRVVDRRIVFFEALSRMHAKPCESPERLFATAAEVGLREELELLAVRSALKGLSRLPEQSALSINISPTTILCSDFESAFRSTDLKRIIIELTEHETVNSYVLLKQALGPLRRRGLRIAIDDTGAGYSSLRHILQIQPEVIKLDMSLTRGIDRDPARKALAAALVSFSHQIGGQLVAEGVETRDELEMLRSVGVDMVQGFFVGAPLPLAE